MGRKQDLQGRIVGMHELVATFRFEGIPLKAIQMASYRNYVAQLEAQLKKPNQPKSKGD